MYLLRQENSDKETRVWKTVLKPVSPRFFLAKQDNGAIDQIII